MLSTANGRYRLVLIALLGVPSTLGPLGLSFIQAGVWQSSLAAEAGPVLFAMSLYGPLLLPAAAWMAATGWRGGRTCLASVAAWASLAIAVASTAAFHLLMIQDVPLP